MNKHNKTIIRIINHNLEEIHLILIRINNNKFKQIKNQINQHLIILTMVLIQLRDLNN